MTDLPLSEVQGFVLRTYAMPALRVFVLKVANAPLAGALLASLTGDDPSIPSLTTATPWATKPDFCVNIAFTSAGLAALGLPAESLATFPSEFVEGAVARAERVGDVGDSSPASWKGDLGQSSDVHALVFLFAQSDEVVERVSSQLRVRFGNGPAFSEISVHDGRALPGNVSHFGYRDGFAQPTIDGGLPAAIADPLPKAPAGEFVLGYASQYKDFTYPVPEPADELGRNGSFVAFRILAQDCDGFEEFLRSASAATGLDPELIAAKLCGRWRNGVPLALSPDTSHVDFSEVQYNTFDYVPTDAIPDAHDDRRGYRCPIGAHVRRMNPRHSVVAGNSGLKRRIMRRGLPYGPPHDPAYPRDGVERGLIGIFIGVSLKDQFEFLMSDWANKGTFAPGLGSTRDPIIGDIPAGAGEFIVPIAGRPAIKLTGLSRFVTCRGGAYCFLPSVTAIRYLSKIAAGQAVPAALAPGV